MSEHDTDQLTLVEILLLATNEKIKVDLAERSEWAGKPAKVSTREIVLVRPAQKDQPPAQTRSQHSRPCPAWRQWARRQKTLKTIRRIFVALALAAPVVGLTWVVGEAW